MLLDALLCRVLVVVFVVVVVVDVVADAVGLFIATVSKQKSVIDIFQVERLQRTAPNRRRRANTHPFALRGPVKGNRKTDRDIVREKLLPHGARFLLVSMGGIFVYSSICH